MTLSFVVPAWNEERYIRQCLTALIRETDKCVYDVEIIVVNNASKDRTGQFASEFPGVVVVDEPRKGLPQARQTGFMASKGDLVANIDADCLLPPGWIEKVRNEFARDDELVALSGPYEYYDLPPLQNLFIKGYYLLAHGMHLLLHRVFKKGAVLQGGNFVLRRTALEKIGGFNVHNDFYGEDTDIARRIQNTGRVKFMPALKMRTSGRRLQKEGVLTMAARYVINFFWVTFFAKPFTRKYTCVSSPGVLGNKTAKE